MTESYRPGQIISLYAYMANTDQEEGRGRSYPVGWYNSFVEAMQAGKGKGAFGSDADDIREYKGVVDENGDIWCNGKKIEIKDMDLKKAKKDLIEKIIRDYGYHMIGFSDLKKMLIDWSEK